MSELSGGRKPCMLELLVTSRTSAFRRAGNHLDIESIDNQAHDGTRELRLIIA